MRRLSALALMVAISTATTAQAAAIQSCRALFDVDHSVVRELARLRFEITELSRSGQQTLAKTLYADWQRRYAEASHMKIDLSGLETIVKSERQSLEVEQLHDAERIREAKRGELKNYRWKPLPPVELVNSSSPFRIHEGNASITTLIEGGRVLQRNILERSGGSIVIGETILGAHSFTSDASPVMVIVGVEPRRQTQSKLALLDTASGKILLTREIEDWRSTVAMVSDDSSSVAIASPTKILVYQIAGAQPLGEISLPTTHQNPRMLSLSSDSKTLMTLSDTTLAVWDIQSGQLLADLKVDHPKTFARFGRLVGSSRYAVADASGHKVEIREVDSGGVETVTANVDSTGEAIHFLSYSGDGEILVGSSETHIYLWHGKSGEVLRKIPVQGNVQGKIQGVTISSDSTMFGFSQRTQSGRHYRMFQRELMPPLD